MSGWTAVVHADRCETLGCLVREVTLKHAPAEGTSLPPLKDWANRVATKATGLLEPLRVLEVDEGRQTALLRSNDPSRRGEDVSYYELLLEGAGTATFRRYHASRTTGGRRDQVAFAFTHEALAKLIADVATSR